MQSSLYFKKKKRKEKKQKFQNERRSKYPKERSLTFALLPIRNDKISIGCARNDNGSESTTYKQLEPSSSQSIASQPLNHSDRSFSFEFTHIFFNYPNYPLYVKTWRSKRVYTFSFTQDILFYSEPDRSSLTVEDFGKIGRQTEVHGRLIQRVHLVARSGVESGNVRDVSAVATVPPDVLWLWPIVWRRQHILMSAPIHPFQR